MSEVDPVEVNKLGEALFFDRLEKARADVEHLKAQRDELISERDLTREEATRQGAEVERLRTAFAEINEACHPNGGVPAWVIVEDVIQIVEKLDIPSQSEGH